MPNSCKSIINRMLHKGAMTQEEHDKILRNLPRWIPCSERLPIKDDCVFVYLFGNSPYIAWHDGTDWCTEDFPLDKDEEPDAWMPLPEPYEEEE